MNNVIKGINPLDIIGSPTHHTLKHKRSNAFSGIINTISGALPGLESSVTNSDNTRCSHAPAVPYSDVRSR